MKRQNKKLTTDPINNIINGPMTIDHAVNILECGIGMGVYSSSSNLERPIFIYVGKRKFRYSIFSSLYCAEEFGTRKVWKLAFSNKSIGEAYEIC